MRKETVDIDILVTSRGMVTEKSCSLSEQQVDLPRENGNQTSSTSSEEHLPKQQL